MGKFKVGDKVCWTKSDTRYQNAVVTKNDTVVFDYRISEDNDYTYAYEHELVAATPQQQLTIREGRYYKTRDGRKVGPARLYNNGKYALYYKLCKWVVDGVLYQDNGTFADGSTPKHDLIAEWADEHTYNANPAAEVDNLRDEYGPVEANDNSRRPKFKVGDKVNYAWSRDCWQGVKITEFRNGMYRAVDPKLGLGAFTEEMLEHASAPAIVALIENGQPKPAERPFVHPNREAAIKEARRLAGKHRGREFGVYELVDTAKEEAEHEWQRLALAGRQTEAVDALVKQAGITRTTARFEVKRAA